MMVGEGEESHIVVGITAPDKEDWSELELPLGESSAESSEVSSRMHLRRPQLSNQQRLSVRLGLQETACTPKIHHAPNDSFDSSLGHNSPSSWKLDSSPDSSPFPVSSRKTLRPKTTEEKILSEESEEEDSDWDALSESSEEVCGMKSPGASFDAHLQGLRNVFGSPANEESSKDMIPLKWRLTDQLMESKGITQVVRYPKPSKLYSLLTKDNARFMQETVLEKWLGDLCVGVVVPEPSPRAGGIPNEIRVDAFTDKAKPAVTNAKHIRKYSSKAKPGSLEWVSHSLEYSWNMYLGRKYDECADAVMRMFRMLGSVTNRTRHRKPLSQGGYDEYKRGSSGSIADLTEEKFTPEEMQDALLKFVTAFRIGSEALARIGKSTSRYSVPECIFTMVEDMKLWSNTYIEEVSRESSQLYLCVEEAQSVAHQLATCVLDSRFDGSVSDAVNQPDSSPAASKRSIESSPPGTKMGEAASRQNAGTWEFSFQPPSSNASPFLSKEARLMEAVLGQFCVTYLEAERASPFVSAMIISKSGNSFWESHPVMVQANCLCNIQLLLHGNSPLTSTETNKLHDALDQLQLELEQWIMNDRSIQTEVVKLVEQSEDESIGMCIGVAQAMEDMEQALEVEKLCKIDPRYRMEKLKALYPQIPATSELKAKAGYVLARYAWDEDHDVNIAEMLLFEALFILKTIDEKSIIACRSKSLLSPLATNIMIFYGDILLEAGKYKFAIGAYESAITAYEAYENTEFKWLYRKLCTVCVDNMDWDRALKYHEKILESVVLSTNLNEFVYISERIAMMRLDQYAEFAKAESSLKLALTYLGGVDPGSSSGPLPTTTSSSSSAHHASLRIKLHQRLAHVYLMANRAQDAAILLSRLLRYASSIPASSSPSPVPKKSASMSSTQFSAQNSIDETSSNMSWVDFDLGGLTGARLPSLLYLAKCCLQIRWLADCTFALDEIAQDVTQGKWCEPYHYFQGGGKGVNPRPRPTSVQIFELLSLLTNHGIENTFKYVVLRASCVMYQGYPNDAVEWIDQALRLAGVAPTESAEEEGMLKLTLGQKGRLFYYRGKFLQCASVPIVLPKVQARTNSVAVSKNACDASKIHICSCCGGRKDNVSGVDPEMANQAFRFDPQFGYLEGVPEQGLHEDACGALWRAYQYFVLIEDTLWQAKTLSRIAEIELEMAHEGLVTEDEMDSFLDKLEETVVSALDLCANIGYAPLMLTCVLNFAELQNLRGNAAKVQILWHEAYSLLNMLYLTGFISDFLSSVSNSSQSAVLTKTSSITKARGQIEQALNTFLFLTKEHKHAVDDASNSNVDEDPIAYPPTRITSVNTSPGLTTKLFQHLSRLIRLLYLNKSVFETNADIASNIFASWNYFADEMFVQHRFITKVMLEEHRQSPLYDNYIYHYFSHVDMPCIGEDFMTRAFREYISIRDDSRNSDLSRSSALEQKTDARHHHTGSKSAFQMNNPRVDYQEVNGSRKFSKARIISFREHHSGPFGQCSHCHDRAPGQNYDVEANISLWSCFHRLKLLSRGQIGHSLHMQEVHSQNMRLLRRIRELGKSLSKAHCGDIASHHGSKEKVIFRNRSRTNSVDVASQGEIMFLAGWNRQLVSLERTNMSMVQYCRNGVKGSGIGNDMIDTLCGSTGGSNAHDHKRTIFGLWCLLKPLGIRHLLRLVATVLCERPVLVLSKSPPVRARAVESLLGLVRPLQWVHRVLIDVPAMCAEAFGYLISAQPYLLGMHPICVEGFLRGSVLANAPLSPVIINLDEGWVEYPQKDNCRLPLPLQTLVENSIAALGSKSEASTWGPVAKQRCTATYKSMERVMKILLPHYSFDGSIANRDLFLRTYCESLFVEDPCCLFASVFAKSSMLRYFGSVSESKKSLARIKIESESHRALVATAKLYRTLVGLSRGCYAWFAVSDYTQEMDVNGDLYAKGTKSLRLFRTSASHQTYHASADDKALKIMKSSIADTSIPLVDRVAFDIQRSQLALVRSAHKVYHPIMLLRPKKKYILLDDKKHFKYFKKKSMSNERGSISLDPLRTRMVIPTRYLSSDLDTLSSLKSVLESHKYTDVNADTDPIPDPTGSSDDEHWIYLVTQLKERNKVRVIKLRFHDESEQHLWSDIFRVNLTNAELLLRIIETAFRSDVS